MPAQRKLGRATDQRKAILKNLTTALLVSGRIETTEARAKEVKNIAEKLITMAIKEADNFTSKSVKTSAAKIDAKGNKLTDSKTSKNGNKYQVMDRQISETMVQVDNPSKLHARRLMMNWVFRPTTADGENINITNKLFDEIAPKYKDKKGGYTRIYKLGPRRGDAAEMVILELV
jgi:large subunit ribosomal protein L17